MTIARWQRKYRTVLDLDATDRQDTIDIEADTALAALRRELLQRYDARPEIDRIMVRVDGAEIGIATRAKAGKTPGHLGAGTATVDPGSGDGATLPGFPGEFRPVRYACPAEHCGETIVRTFYDERAVPRCGKHPGTAAIYQVENKS